MDHLLNRAKARLKLGFADIWLRPHLLKPSLNICGPGDPFLSHIAIGTVRPAEVIWLFGADKHKCSCCQMCFTVDAYAIKQPPLLMKIYLTRLHKCSA